MALRMPGQAKRLLIELGSGAIAGGGIGYATSDDNLPAEKMDDVAVGAFIGALGAGVAGNFLRGRRVQKLMRNGGYGDESSKPFVDYYKNLSSPRRLPQRKVISMVDNMAEGPTRMFNGMSPKAVLRHIDTVELDATRFGKAKAVQTAYGTMKQDLMNHGFKSEDAAKKTREAIFDSQGRAVDLRRAKKILNSPDFSKAEMAHRQRYLDGRIDPVEINQEIIDFARVPGVVDLSPGNQHLQVPQAYQELKKVLANLEDPKYRSKKEVRYLMGQEIIERLVSMNAPFGLGKIRKI